MDGIEFQASVSIRGSPLPAHPDESRDPLRRPYSLSGTGSVLILPTTAIGGTVDPDFRRDERGDGCRTFPPGTLHSDRQCAMALTISSVIFFASPNSIIVFGRKNSSFSTPA